MYRVLTVLSFICSEIKFVIDCFLLSFAVNKLYILREFKKQYKLISKKNLGNALPVVRIIKVVMALTSYVCKEILYNKITIT